MAIKHSFVSLRPDSTDPTKIKASNWNQDHVVEDIVATGGNFYWDNTLNVLKIGYAGIYSGIRAAAIAVKNLGPDWATINRVWDCVRIAINGFPENAQLGSDLVSCSSAITGAIDVPSNSAFSGGIGVSGYSRISATTGGGAVGLFGAGLCGVDGAAGTWGINVVATNSSTCHNTISHSAPPEHSYTNTNIFGMEVDCKINAADSGNTNVTCRGLFLAYDATVANPHPDVYAIDVYSHTQPQKWKVGYRTDDASCIKGMSIGTAALGNNTGSQPIEFRSRDASGVEKDSEIIQDPNGVLTFRTGMGSFQDAAGVAHLQYFGGQIQFLAKPIFPTLAPPASATASGIKGEIRYANGFIYVCVNTDSWQRVAIAAW